MKAISFVGGNTAGQHIHTRASANGKRVQANMGAKSAYFWLTLRSCVFEMTLEQIMRS